MAYLIYSSIIMPNKENFFIPRQRELRLIADDRDHEKSPSVVVKQTDTLLRLFYQGVINKPGPAKEYLHDYTINAYLKKAEKGSVSIYDKSGQSHDEIDSTEEEAARHAFSVFAHMPDKAKSHFLPKGYSRRLMLKAPGTQGEFSTRIKELKFIIWQVVEGIFDSHVSLEAYPSRFRTYQFFEVANGLPMSLTLNEDEAKREQEDNKKIAEKIAKRKLENLLGDIDVTL